VRRLQRQLQEFQAHYQAEVNFPQPQAPGHQREVNAPQLAASGLERTVSELQAQFRNDSIEFCEKQIEKTNQLREWGDRDCEIMDLAMAIMNELPDHQGLPQAASQVREHRIWNFAKEIMDVLLSEIEEE
jgi:hypothetical protein